MKRVEKIDEVGPRQARVMAASLNHKLLSMRSWCSLHRRSYAQHVMIGEAVTHQTCPKCAADVRWIDSAREQLRDEGVNYTKADLLNRAESLAGHRLELFKRPPGATP